MYVRRKRRRDGAARNGKPYQIHNHYRMLYEIKDRATFASDNKFRVKAELKMKETTRLLYKNAIQIEHKFRRSLNNTRQLPPGAQLKDVKGQKPNHGGF